MQTNRSCCVPGTGFPFCRGTGILLRITFIAKISSRGNLLCRRSILLLPLLRSFVLHWFNWNFIRIDTFRVTIILVRQKFLPCLFVFLWLNRIFRDENRVLILIFFDYTFYLFALLSFGTIVSWKNKFVYFISFLSSYLLSLCNRVLRFQFRDTKIGRILTIYFFLTF